MPTGCPEVSGFRENKDGKDYFLQPSRVIRKHTQTFGAKVLVFSGIDKKKKMQLQIQRKALWAAILGDGGA